MRNIADQKRDYAKLLALGVLTLVLYGWVFSGSARGQVVTTSGITGTVTDASGAIIPGAAVSLKNVDTGARWSMKSDSVGFYSFPSLPPGTYTITVSQPGFQTMAVSDRTILAGSPAQVDFKLRVGDAAQVVQVSGEGAELLSTTSATVSQTISTRLVQDLPNITRNFMDLVILTPGAVPDNLSLPGSTFAAQDGLNIAAAVTGTQPGGVQHTSGVMVGGNRDTGSNVSVDGSNVQNSQYGQTMQLQAIGDIEEVRVESGNMSAEFGNGTAAVTVITKSGTNQLHGDVFEFLRNNVLDSNNFFSNQQGLKLPTYQQNQFGADAGGPIVKDKLLFFGSYEGSRIHQGINQETVVPSTALRSGNFNGVDPVIYNPYAYDPATGLRQPFPNDTIPTTMIDPVAAALMQKYTPLPNGIFLNQPALVGAVQALWDSDQYTGRIDYEQSMTSRLYGRYTESTMNSEIGSLFPLQGFRTPYTTYNPNVHWTRTFSPSAVNDLMLGFTRFLWNEGAAKVLPTDVGATVGLVNSQFPTVTTNRSIGVAPTGSLYSTQNTFDIKDDLSYIRGRHTLKFGVDLEERRYYRNDPNNTAITFTSAEFSSACPLLNAACAAAQKAAGLPTGGDPFADFQLGTLTQSSNQFNPTPYSAYRRYLGAYAQDSWRATPRLTVNYGLRYEYFGPWDMPRHDTANYNPLTGQVNYVLQNPLDFLNAADCYGRCAPLNPSVPSAGYSVKNLNFAPRLGLAYQLFSKTVIRASAGIFFDPNVNLNQFYSIQSRMAPFKPQSLLINDASQQLPQYLLKNQSPSLGTFTVPSTLSLIPNSAPPAAFRMPISKYQTASVYEWSISLQQRLGEHFQAEANYLGSHTVHELMTEDLNAAPLAATPAEAAIPFQQRRLQPEWGTVTSWIPIGWAKYDALFLSMKSLPWHGLTMMAHYDWAKNLMSDSVIGSDQSTFNYWYPYVWAGPSNLTPYHSFTLGFDFALPVGRGAAFGSSISRAMDGFIGGWHLAGTWQASQGAPQAISWTPDASGTGENVQHPNIIPGCNPNMVPGGRTRSEWFNTACFTAPAAGTYGDSTFGVEVDPGINNWNMSLAKSFRIKDKGALDLRWETFNTFNHTQWGPSVVSNSNAASFGVISSARPARQMQFGLKYKF